MNTEILNPSQLNLTIDVVELRSGAAGSFLEETSDSLDSGSACCCTCCCGVEDQPEAAN